MPLAHLKTPTVDGIVKRYRERSHDYCYWSHEEVTALIAEVERLRRGLEDVFGVGGDPKDMIAVARAALLTD